jgi:multidrug efflux system membrane fusion protein
MAIVELSTGSVMAETYVQVLPQVSGRILHQGFREGQFVRRGDLLFEIDPSTYQAAVAQAQGIYARDQAQLHNAQLAQRRVEILFTQGFASQQMLDEASANTEVAAASAASDRAAVETARLNLNFTFIRAPIAGKTGPVLVQPGNIVNAGGATTLVTIAQVRPIKVSFTLPQNDLPRIEARQRQGGLMARIDSDGSGAGTTAPVDFVSNTVNQMSGTMELRATFANDDLSLVPGQLVQVVVQIGDLPDAIVAPRDAVNDSPSGPYVYVVRQNRAVMTPVRVLFDDGTDAAVSGDLRPGDMVITEGQLRVDAGAKVHVLGRSTPPARMASDRVHSAR